MPAFESRRVRTQPRTVTGVSAGAFPPRMSSQERASGTQVLVEEVDRALPGELRRRLIVAGCRVVVEAVLGLGIDVRFVLHLVRLERGFVRGPSRVDPLVV